MKYIELERLILVAMIFPSNVSAFYLLPSYLIGLKTKTNICTIEFNLVEVKLHISLYVFLYTAVVEFQKTCHLLGNAAGREMRLIPWLVRNILFDAKHVFAKRWIRKLKEQA